MNEKNKYLRPEDVAKLLKVTVRTLQNWSDDGYLKCVRTAGGHRRFLKSDVFEKLGSNQQEYTSTGKRKICYCRVSTSSQKEDLERQIEYFRSKYPDYEIVKDIGSGLNFKRKGFNSILDSAIKGDIEEIVVTHKDRLCRFGFELVQRIIEGNSNGKIVVLDQEKTSPEKELVNDLISIVTVFSSRLYGLRSNSVKRKIKLEASKNIEDKVVSNDGGKGEITTDV